MRGSRSLEKPTVTISFGQFVKEFSQFYKPHKKLFFIDMCCAFLVAVCNLLYPPIAQNIINDYVPNGLLRTMLIWAGVLLVLYFVKAGLNYVINYWGHIMGVRIQGDMRAKLFRHLQKLPFSYYDEHKTGTIMSRLINDLFDISELAHHGPEDLFLSVVTIVGAIVMMAFIYWPLALIVLAFLPLMIICVVSLRKEMTETWRQTRIKTGEINASVESSVAGIRVARAYTADAHEAKKFAAANQGYQTARKGVYKVMGKFQSAMNLFNDLLYLLVLVAGGLFFYYGKINEGEFVAFVLYISRLLNPLRILVALFEQIQGGMSGFQRYKEVMEVAPEEETGTQQLQSMCGDIEYQNVNFAYVEGQAVLNNLSLTIKKGSTVAFVGPSGGGKTTLCHLLPRFYEINSGAITVGGEDVRSFSRLSLRKNIGIVQQDVFLFSGTIRENIAYGNLDATEEEIIEAAKKANIHDFISTLPQGYDTEVGERGVKLSGGQKQRVSIARAFLKNPPILILDEATSALDNVTEMQIQQALERLSVGRTTIVVAHRLSTVKNADNIYVITKEGVTESGTHEQLVQKGGYYATLYEASLQGCLAEEAL